MRNQVLIRTKKHKADHKIGEHKHRLVMILYLQTIFLEFFLVNEQANIMFSLIHNS